MRVIGAGTFIGIWRPAGPYRGPRLWAVLARVGIWIGIGRTAREALLIWIATDLRSSRQPEHLRARVVRRRSSSSLMGAAPIDGWLGSPPYSRNG